MTTDIWQRVQDIFERVLDAPPEDRPAMLDEACGDDAGLRAEVESLLAHQSQACDGFLASPVLASQAAQAEPDTWADKLLGTKIGRYTLVRLIAVGGMGCVFEAAQDQPARSVALKVLRPGLSASSALARFRLEPEVLGRLRHPNIAQVFEAGVHDDEPGALPYFAMELIPEAQPLIDYADVERLTVRQRLELFAHVCDAVQHGHQKGIIHRDLKPSNILVGRDGQPRVIDFGVARSTDADIMLTTQCTRTGELVGTLHYMSPEQCDGDSSAIDTRTDIYSLGVVLYELLAGSAPYDTSGTTIYAAIRVIKDEPPRRPSEFKRRLRGDVEAILLKALEKSPARRYESSAALAQDIRRHLSGETIEARPPTLATRVLRWAVRHPVIVTSAACVLMLVITAIASALVVWYTSMRPDRVVIVGKNKAAQLQTATGTVLKSWYGGDRGQIEYAELVAAPAAASRGPLAIIGYRGNNLRGPRGSFAFYDLNRDRNAAYMELRLDDADIPVEEIRQRRRDDGRVFLAQNFGAVRALLADVFPDAGGAAVNELIAVFMHESVTHSAVCIYRLDGTLCYRVWVDAAIGDLYWMAKPRLLVCAGLNGAALLEDRLVNDPPGCGPAHPPVVFAIKPEADLILPNTALCATSYIEQEPALRKSAPAPLRPVWYHCVQPFSEQYCQVTFNIADNKILSEPTVYAVDPDNAVRFTITLADNIEGKPNTIVGEHARRGWIITGETGVVSDGYNADGYIRFERSPENPNNPLPPWDSWYLGELPPIRPATP